MRSKSPIFFALPVVVLSAVLVYGQGTSGIILGTVTDPQGAVMAGVTVAVKNLDTQLQRQVVTDSSGYYRVEALPVGRYEVRAERQGFKVTVESLTLTVGEEAVTNFKLEVGSLNEQVIVTSTGTEVETTTATMGGLVDEKKIRDLPLNGRSFDQLIYLQPGVTVATSAGASPNQGRGTKFSVSGARLTSNLFMLDGTDMNDSQNFTPGGAGGQMFGVESIKEFKVITHNAPAEYGRSMGGIINAVSNTGTNKIHGDLFEFLRNSALDAKNFFDSPTDPIPPFKRNQFGGVIGGPIHRDKIFYFANYEGLRERLGVTHFAQVPDDDARAGRIIDRVTGKVTTVTVNSAVVPYLNLIPRANGPATATPGVAILQFSNQQPTNVNYVTGRIDWNRTANDSIFARYTIDDSTKLRQDAPDHVLGLFAEDEGHRNQYITLQDTRIISSTKVNQLRFGFNRSTLQVNLINQANVPASLSFIPGQPFGHVSITGASPLGTVVNDPRAFFMNSYQPSDDFSVTHGNHAFKTGVFIERFQWNTSAFNRIGGDYSFASLSDFLTAKVKSAVVPFPGADPHRSIRATLFAGYFQDDWRVRRRLTLNLGLRYELTTVPTETHGQSSFLLSPLSTSLQIHAPFAGNHKNFAPRVGFAWDVRGDGKTSVRGGFGIYYDQIVLNQFLNLFDRNPSPDLKSGWLSVTLPITSVTPAVPATFPNPPSPAQIQAGCAAKPSSCFSLQNVVFDNYKTPYLYQYSLEVQRQLAKNLVASVAYVGSRGKHLVERIDGNTPVPIVLAGGVPCNSGAVSATNPILPAGTLCTPKTATRRNPNWDAIQTRSLNGLSWYDSMQVSVLRRFSAGLQVQGTYTWSKSLDTSAGLFSEEADNAATGVAIPDNIRNEKGRSNFDVRHNGVINVLYELPFGKSLKGAGRQLLSGWQIGGIGTFVTGVPFTVENSGNRSQNQATGSNFADRPNLVTGASNNPTSGVSAGCTFGTSSIAAGTPLGTPTHWFDPCAFVPQPLGTFGNLGRNTLNGPGRSTIDFLVNKHFRISEKRELQFRTEVFNLLNHPNFEAPNTANRRIFDNTGSANLVASGQLTNTTTTSRQIQFGLKFIF
jgi:Carboxypeptidase regulatory-like domain/TonB dependent receptor/TonB-dependent Receptor Plug Domain